MVALFNDFKRVQEMTNATWAYLGSEVAAELRRQGYGHLIQRGETCEVVRLSDLHEARKQKEARSGPQAQE